MSLVDRVVRSIRGMANDVVDNSIDPGTMARQLTREMEEKITNAESSLISVKAKYIVLEKKRDRAKEDVATWTANAEKAVKQGKEDLARQCLQTKRLHDATALDAQKQLDTMKPTLDALEGSIRQLKAKHSQMKNETAMLEARGDVADAQQEASRALDGISSSDISSEFDKLREKVDESEAKAKVMSEQSVDETENLQTQLDALDGDTSIEDELNALKSKNTTK